MVDMVRREMVRVRAMAVRSEVLSVTEEASMAMSVPSPMEMPMSAAARAGASLMPSPTMATMWPSLRSDRMAAALSSGSASAW